MLVFYKQFYICENMKRFTFHYELIMVNFVNTS